MTPSRKVPVPDAGRATSRRHPSGLPSRDFRAMLGRAPRPCRSRLRLACSRRRIFSRRRIEDLKEIFVEVEDRVRVAGLSHENGGIEAVDGVEDDVEADPDVATISSMLSTRSVVRSRECSGGMFRQASRSTSLSEASRTAADRTRAFAQRRRRKAFRSAARCNRRLADARRAPRGTRLGLPVTAVRCLGRGEFSELIGEWSERAAAWAKLPASCFASAAGGGSARASGVNAAMSAAGSPRRIRRSAFTSVVSGSSAASGTISTEFIASPRLKTRKLEKFEIAQTGSDLNRSNCCLS